MIFGTNVDLEKSIDENTFAHELFERIDKNVLTIPPLRNRKGDIPLLVEYFKNDINQNSGFKIEISKETIELLMEYNWPGNIRQLGHFIEGVFRKARSKNILIITRENILASPPRNDLKTKNPFRNLEISLREILKTWQIENGSMLEELVKPMLSKLYVGDFKGKVKEANKFIGIDGIRGTRNALQKYFEKYTDSQDKYLK